MSMLGGVSLLSLYWPSASETESVVCCGSGIGAAAGVWAGVSGGMSEELVNEGTSGTSSVT